MRLRLQLAGLRWKQIHPAARSAALPLDHNPNAVKRLGPVDTYVVDAGGSGRKPLFAWTQLTGRMRSAYADAAQGQLREAQWYRA